MITIFVACLTSLIISLLYFIRDVNMSLHALEMEIGFSPATGD